MAARQVLDPHVSKMAQGMEVVFEARAQTKASEAEAFKARIASVSSTIGLDHLVHASSGGATVCYTFGLALTTRRCAVAKRFSTPELTHDMAMKVELRGIRAFTLASQLPGAKYFANFYLW